MDIKGEAEELYGRLRGFLEQKEKDLGGQKTGADRSIAFALDEVRRQVRELDSKRGDVAFLKDAAWRHGLLEEHGDEGEIELEVSKANPTNSRLTEEEYNQGFRRGYEEGAGGRQEK